MQGNGTRYVDVARLAKSNGWLGRVGFFAVLMVLLGVMLAPAMAQTGGQGAIEGTVTDSTGAVVSNAMVTATNQASGVTTSRPTSSSGLYTINPVIPGTYTVTVTATGFQRVTQQNLVVDALKVTGAEHDVDDGQRNRECDGNGGSASASDDERNAGWRNRK